MIHTLKVSMPREKTYDIYYKAKEISNFFTQFNRIACTNCISTAWDKNGCCQTCARYSGHYSLGYGSINDREKERQYKLLKKLFWIDDEVGFLDKENKTCNIPRHLRSYICLKYCCIYEMERVIRPKVMELIELRKANGIYIY